MCVGEAIGRVRVGMAEDVRHAIGIAVDGHIVLAGAVRKITQILVDRPKNIRGREDDKRGQTNQDSFPICF